MNGILNIYKEQGYTSHDVVAILRRILKTKKIGHTGTLDPNAEGVLPICVGNATKLSELLMEKQKTYQVTMQFGKVTDTQDIWGNVTEERKVELSEEEVIRELMTFVGEIEQIPPMYSAVKQGGKKLYELAREGKIVERKARPVTIYRIEEVRFLQGHELRFTVTCSKGTYIRTLCHDLGQMLGCGAVMTALLRTQSGNFGLENALKLDEVEKLQAQGKLTEQLISVESAITARRLIVEESFSKWLYAGNPIPYERIVNSQELSQEQDAKQSVNSGDKGNLYYVYDHAKRFIGIYTGYHNTLKVLKFFYQASEE